MYEEQIRRGIEWLEIEHPEIDINAVDLGCLHMDEWDSCILGQLMGGIRSQHIIIMENGEDWAVRYGFHLMGGDEAEWDLLTREWVRILRARKAAPESRSTS